MQVKLALDILPQPDEDACGPTCLHAVYRYYGDHLPLARIIKEVPRVPGGGTVSVLLGCHALRRGYQARLYSYNLNLFDPTWFDLSAADLRRKLRAQRAFKKAAKFRQVTDAFLEFLALGGEVAFTDLTKSLIRKYLNRHLPILAGLSSTYLYRCAREYGPRSDYHDLRGSPAGHFVVLSGYDKDQRLIEISDPLLPNPVSPRSPYTVDIDRVIGAILLGVVTYDANLLIIQPR